MGKSFKRIGKGRLDPVQSDHVRSKIQSSQVANYLIKVVEGTAQPHPVRVQAALGLLKKVLPDLASVENTGDLQTAFVIRAPEPAADVASWEASSIRQPLDKEPAKH